MTYLLVSCNECGSIYRAYRVVSSKVNEHWLSINFCMFCASTSISIAQLDTEQTWIQHMAEKYNKPTEYIETMLEAFEVLPKGAKTTFAQMCGAK